MGWRLFSLFFGLCPGLDLAHNASVFGLELIRGQVLQARQWREVDVEGRPQLNACSYAGLAVRQPWRWACRSSVRSDVAQSDAGVAEHGVDLDPAAEPLDIPSQGGDHVVVAALDL
jgi:hypothetical protein